MSDRALETWLDWEREPQPKMLAGISPVTDASEAAIGINPVTDFNCSIWNVTITIK